LAAKAQQGAKYDVLCFREAHFTFHVFPFSSTFTYGFRHQVHKPPLNHIGLWVDHLPQAVDWMAQQGVRFAPGGIRTGAAGFEVAFIHPVGNAEHPVSGNGVLIELVQAPEAVIDKFQ